MVGFRDVLYAFYCKRLYDIRSQRVARELVAAFTVMERFAP